MLHLRIVSPAGQTEDVLGALRDDPGISSLSVLPGAAMRPAGDLVLADVAREAADDVVGRLRAVGVHRTGSVHVEPVPTWLSKDGYDAERRTPGSSADSVVWAQVIQRAYEDTELNWTYASFMTLATLIATVAIVLDSQILVIGAMVLGPEFGAVAALGVSLVKRRRALFWRATRALLVGFAVAITLTTAFAWCAKLLGWVTLADVTGPRPGTEFIYSPNKWSFIVALIAGAAGVLSLTSAKTGGLSGVFISVTTIPAAGNVALGLAFGAGTEVWGSPSSWVSTCPGWRWPAGPHWPSNTRCGHGLPPNEPSSWRGSAAERTADQYSHARPAVDYVRTLTDGSPCSRQAIPGRAIVGAPTVTSKRRKACADVDGSPPPFPFPPRSAG